MESRVRKVALAVVGVTVVALAGAGITAASLSAAAATSSATSTRVTISGVVPEGARDNVTVSAAQVLYSKEAEKPGIVHPVDPTTGAFSFTIAKTTKKFTLFFNEGNTEPWFDSYLGGVHGENGEQSDGFTVFSASSSHDLGTVGIPPAGVIEGTLTSTEGDPVPGAQVYAQPTSGDDDWSLLGFSDKTGRYSVKVERDTDYRVLALANNYEETYFPSAETEAEATVVTPDAAHGYVLSGTDITAAPAKASILASFSKANTLSLYQAYLYALDGDGHPISSVPTRVMDDSQHDFFFYDLASVNYGIAFRNSATGAWVPWKSYTGSANAPAATATSANRCLLPFTGVRGPIQKLGRITLGTTACGEPFTGSAVSSGTVSNPNPGSKIVASLYYVVPGSDPTPADGFDNRDVVLVNSTTVATDGSYSMNGISAAGTYVTKFSASSKSPFFDTWQGGFLLNADNARTQAIDAAPDVAANTASTENDVTMVKAAYVRGTVKLGGKPVAGVSVWGHVSPAGIDDGGVGYIGQGYSLFVLATTSSHGAYALKIVPGDDYTISASKGRYHGVYGTPPGGTVVTATAPGTVPGAFTIALKKS